MMACLESIGADCVLKLGVLVVKSIKKQVEYLIHHRKLVGNMTEEHENLKRMKEDLQGTVDADRRSGLLISKSVEKWLSDVVAIEKKVKECENEETNNKKCFGGLCPNLARNYSVGKQATKREETIKGLKKERNEIDIISYPKPPPELGSTSTQHIKGLESRNKIINDVMEKLKDDKFKMISICGMGGVGKTTLANEVIEIAKTNKLFDRAVMAVVSKDRNYKQIQTEIADWLGFQFKAEIVQVRAGALREHLKNIGERLLIVLDDVWEELEFDKIGLPSLEHEKVCKILFTSRSTEVCRKMMGSSESIVELTILNHDEGWKLFREMAGSDVVDRDDIKPIAQEVAEECKGLPLAIVTVGRGLGAKTERHQWEDARDRLRDSQLDKKVHSSIELSIEYLGSPEHKYCLFLCALFPEDFDIPVESVFRHEVGMGFIEVDGDLRKARNRVDTLVDDLRRCFLLLESQKKGCVKIHDVVRDVVLSINSKKDNGFVVKGNLQLKKGQNDYAKAMSLILDDTKDLENGLNCPKLELLQVQPRTKESISWPENSFQGRSQIRVLTMMKVSIPTITSLFQAYVVLTTLLLEDCDVGDVSAIGKELVYLEILSFSNSNIKELPIEIGQLGKLRLLDLTGCDDLDFISNNVFQRLSHLEELYFRVENFAWMLNKIVLMELNKLSEQLKVLEIRVRKLEILPKNLSFRNLERFWIYVVPCENYGRDGYLESNMLQFNSTSYSSIKGSSIMQLVKKCEILILEKVNDLKNVISELHNSEFQYLKYLILKSCPSLEYLVDCSTACNAFPVMKSLSLKNLEKFRAICKTSDHDRSEKALIQFSNLEYLKLKNLPKFIGFSNIIDLIEAPLASHHGSSHTNELVGTTEIEEEQPVSGSTPKPGCHNKLFSSIDWMQQFPKLEAILLFNCTSLEVIFNFEEYSETKGQPRLFPHLQKINISYLNNLTHLWGCAPHNVHGFQNLRSLTISECNSLSYVFTLVILKAIINLEELEVSSCDSMETLIAVSEDAEEYSETKDQPFSVLFPHLQKINISDLNKLTHVWGGAPLNVHGFQNLRSLTISECNSLSYVFTLVILKTIINLEELEVSSCNSMETLIAVSEDAEEGDYKGKGKKTPIVFNKLCSVSLSSLPKLGSVCVDSLELEWPSLRKFSFDDCPMLKISLKPTHQLHEKLDKVGGASSSNIEDTNSSNLKESKFRSSPLSLGCTPWQQKFNRQNRKNNNKAVSLTENLEPAVISEIKNNTGISHVPILEDLTVIKCNLLYELFLLEEKDNPTTLMTFFTKLESLHLSNLPNLARFYSSTINDKQEDTVSCERSEARIGHNPFLDGLLVPNLRSLSIAFCDKINILFSHSTLRSLEVLEVKSCKNLEEIVCDEEKIKGSGDEIMFPKLQKLILESLPNLKAFCQGSYNFEFQSLRKVKIVDCPNIEAFSRGSTHAPLLDNVKMRNRNTLLDTCIEVQNGDLNAVTDGFKALVTLQESDMMRWNDFNDTIILKISRITIDEFRKLLMLVPFKEIHMLQHVKELMINNCDSLNEVFESEGGMRCSKEGDGTIRYELQSLYLIDLPKLRCIWGPNTMRHVGFDKLTSIRIYRCHSLKSLVSYSMARSLVQLSRLEVGNCEMIEEIVSKEDNNSNSGAKVKTLFPKLEKLWLFNLPKLTSVCSGDYDYDIPLCDEINDKEKQVQISFPLLEEFYLHEVPRLKCFCSGAYDYHLMLSSSSSSSSPCIDIEKSTQVVTTPNLHKMSVDYKTYLIRTEGDLNLTINCIHNSKKYKEELQKLERLESVEQHQYQHLRAYITRVTVLQLDSCHKLLSCFPSNLMHLFKHLTTLRVQQCGLLEEIFESNNDCAETMELERIELHSLPKLKHIWRNNQGSLSGFQNIRYLSIKECHDLKFVFPNVSAAGSLPNLRRLEVHKCNKMEEIITCNNNNNDNVISRRAKIIFQYLGTIELKELPELKCFCSSSFYFELPYCTSITIEECQKMETFCYGTLYTPDDTSFNIEGTDFDGESELNERLQEIKEYKYKL